MSELILNERGAVGTVMLLLLIPLFIVGLLLTMEHPRLVHGADIDLGQAVADATRAAAMCVDERSQANGQPRIDPDRAHETFRRMLAANLGLSDVTLEPLPGSGMKAAPSYILVVYNGDDTWMPGARKYSDGGGVDLPSYGFPQAFTISSDDIAYGSGERSVTLRAPGCVAVVRDTVKPVARPEGVKATRYAVAEIQHH
ncbi:MAG: hypothetical protein ACOYU7_03935 [Bacillota bacterium]